VDPDRLAFSLLIETFDATVWYVVYATFAEELSVKCLVLIKEDAYAELKKFLADTSRRGRLRITFEKSLFLFLPPN